MMPLIRNVLFVTIFIIAAIVALANMGMNVTPLLAGAGVIGLAIGFGAQSLVADLITGLFIIIEDSWPSMTMWTSAATSAPSKA